MARRTFLASLGLDDVPYATAAAIPKEWLNGAHKHVPAQLPQEIHDGQERWRHLLSLAGTLRARGLGETAIVEQLEVFNRSHCRPPKPDADLRRIARWMIEHDGADGIREDPDSPRVSSWAPVDLAAVADGSTAEEPPSILARTDGQSLLYRRKRHLLAGEPEAGKGWVAAAAAPEITGRERVLYLDLENTATTALERLNALGVALVDVLEHFVYVRPDGPPDVDLGELAAGAVLAVVDGVTECMNLLGLNPYDNRDVAQLLTKIARPLADAGAAVLLIDHVVIGWQVPYYPRPPMRLMRPPK